MTTNCYYLRDTPSTTPGKDCDRPFSDYLLSNNLATSPLFITLITSKYFKNTSAPIVIISSFTTLYTPNKLDFCLANCTAFQLSKSIP